jgi:diguanylate cyclase (GGDEF)-like protein/PAS domain S-box-containing protein
MHPSSERRPRWRSIRTRLFLVYSLILGLICLFITLYFPARLQAQAMRSVAAKAESIGAMMAYSLAPLLYFSDDRAFDPVIRSARENPDLLYVVIAAPDGGQLGAWNLDQARLEGFAAADGGFSASPDGLAYRARATINRNGFEVGHVYFGLSLEGVRREVSSSRWDIAAVSLGVFLIGTLAVLGVSVLITGPLNRVVETARRITAGDLSRRTSVRSRDEVGQLAEAFDGMVDHLVSAQADLSVLNQDLEARVAERTRELEHEVEERAQAERLLLVSRERYALAARGSNDGLWDWDLRTGEVYYSPRWRSMLGFGEAEVVGPPSVWLDLVHPEDRPRLEAEMGAHTAGLTAHFEHEYRVRHADGSARWMLARGLAVRDDDGRATRMSGSQTDITERKRAEEQLLHDALHDGLTGLPNRVLFMDRLAQVFKRALRRKDYDFAVYFFDLDRFKFVNDSYGHEAGDELLRAVAVRLQACLRPTDTVARLGGDEFAILADGLTSEEGALEICRRVQQALAPPLVTDGREVFCTASVGIALGADRYLKPEEILRDADTAMYRAKGSGRGRHAVFQAGMHLRVLHQFEMETALRRALEASEFRVHYQPIVEMTTGAIRCVEALVRWEHPERGQIPPSEFIPLAEESGLVVAMDRWVMREACRQVRAWQVQFPSARGLCASVNLSSIHFARPEVLQDIRGALEDSGLEGRYLKLELTERVLVENADSLEAVFQWLRKTGIQLVIDDFGTGYSSLSYLHRFPVDVLKVDRSFVEGIGGAERRGEIARTVVSLAHTLGLAVVAEGVETAEQRSFLSALHCEYAQGYLFSPPLDAEALEGLLQRQTSAVPRDAQGA